MTRQDMTHGTEQDKTMTGQGQDRTEQDIIGQEKTEQDNTAQDKKKKERKRKGREEK